MTKQELIQFLEKIQLDWWEDKDGINSIIKTGPIYSKGENEEAHFIHYHFEFDTLVDIAIN